MKLAETENKRSKTFDVEAIRKDFPILNQDVNGKPLAFFDNAASTQKPSAVIDALQHYYENDHANIHRGVHTLSQRATEAYENARKRIASYINARGDREVIFVRGATEAINVVAQSFGRMHFKNGGNIVITAMEHHANIVPWQLAGLDYGIEIRVVPIDEHGVLDLSEYDRMIDGQTRIVALCHTSNALGTINPVKSMIEVAHSKDVPVLLDSAQAIPHFDVDVQDLDCDFMVFSGHKLFGPTGIGVLYGKAEYLDEMPPYQGGGDMIEHVYFDHSTFKAAPARFEAGTPHISGAIGLAAAVGYLSGLDRIALEAYEKKLLEQATEAVSDIPGLKIYGTARDKVGVLSFRIKDVHPHDIGTLLDAQGIAVRTGHHCCEPLMRLLGVSGTTRASLAFYNTAEEVDRLAKGLHGIQKMFA